MSDIRIENLSRFYTLPDGKRVAALHDCSLSVRDGSFTVIVGKSGCGKTTLLRLLAGLEQPDEGILDFGGPRPRTGVMFQTPRLLPWLTVEENVCIWQHGMGGSAELAGQYLKDFGLDSFHQAYPDQLSGGMAQRAALVRTLSCRPRLLLMDEPFAALDYFTREKLQDELMDQYVRQPMTIVFITHDLDEAVRLGQDILVMHKGCCGGRVRNDEGYPRPSVAGRLAMKTDILHILNEEKENRI